MRLTMLCPETSVKERIQANWGGDRSQLTYEIDFSSWVNFRHLLFKNFHSFIDAACCWDMGGEDLYSVCLHYFLDASPMRHLNRSKGRAELYQVKSQETMTKHDGIPRGSI